MTDDAEFGVSAGQIVAEKFRLVELLGQGGMGSVWTAEHLTLNSPVALKILKPEVACKRRPRARFLAEAKAAAKLRSTHVVQILDSGEDGDVAFICMELLEGESLTERLKRERRLAPDVTLTIMTHVGRAVARAHAAGLVHRDLKPANIFLVSNDGELVGKVLDFGIAKSMDADFSADLPPTATGALLGTPHYMSPEQLAGEKTLDHRTDLWAMGVIAFECLCGRRPFVGGGLADLVLAICQDPLPIPSEIAPVPGGFDTWFARATAREPAMRFDSAKALCVALAGVLELGELSEEAHAEAPAEEPAPAPEPEPAEEVIEELDEGDLEEIVEEA